MDAERLLKLPEGSVGPDAWTVVRRVLWGVSWFLLFRPFPRRIGNRWRSSLLRLFGARIGTGVLLSPSMKVMKPWELEIGDYSAIGARVDFYNFCMIKVGSMSLISQDCYLCTGSHDYTDPRMPLKTKPIEIGSGVWLSARTFVLPGASIEDGAVVGACSVVSKKICAWTVCAGNPCVQIKQRRISK